MEIKVIHEDDDIVVIEKPVGVVSNSAATVRTESLQDWMVSTGRVPPAPERPKRVRRGINIRLTGEDYFLNRNGLVHRLDKETSGVMILAKNTKSFVELLRQFKERETKKEYLALTHGIWEPKQGQIELPIGRMKQDRKMMGVREDGRESRTGYKVISEYTNWEFPPELGVKSTGYEKFSLVRFAPLTGRMHQIRVHARHLGHAIVGDDVYAGRKRAREDRKWTGRMMLAAVSLEITHPTTGKRVKFESEGEIGEIVGKYLS